MALNNSILKVIGMSCSHCAESVKGSLGVLNGVAAVKVDLATKKVSVEYDSEKVSLGTIKDTIEDQGYIVDK